MKKQESGFTFVELLVVVTIIAVITGIAVASYQVTNKKARDARRKSDLQQVRAALELCRSEASAYPATLTFDPNNTLVCDDGQTYLNPLPVDPRYGQVGYDYSYERGYLNPASVVEYELCATAMETDGDGYLEGDSYCVYNP